MSTELPHDGAKPRRRIATAEHTLGEPAESRGVVPMILPHGLASLDSAVPPSVPSALNASRNVLVTAVAGRSL